MNDISLEEMLKSGVHFGHRSSSVYPKMKPFIFSERQGVCVIDLEKTKQALKEAQDFFKKIAEKNGNILFVGTKKQASPIIKKYAQQINMPYITDRWVGGTFTNFRVIKKMINKYKNLKNQKKSGELEKYTKKERLEINEEIERLDQIIGGIADMDKLPDAVYIVDVKNQKTVINEAVKKNIPIVAMVDVNSNPKGIKNVIPANDDATKSLELITKALTESYASQSGTTNKNKKEKEDKDKNNKGEK
ncbi:MAG: 30S ribosomal protein S2 [Patescibacteria group bacterium]|nr:30S ribosomal protein S2 [Patescibacteria group bacterium]